MYAFRTQKYMHDILGKAHIFPAIRSQFFFSIWDNKLSIFGHPVSLSSRISLEFSGHLGRVAYDEAQSTFLILINV